jgi:hypothetical protein
VKREKLVKTGNIANKGVGCRVVRSDYYELLCTDKMRIQVEIKHFVLSHFAFLLRFDLKMTIKNDNQK